MQQNSVRMKRVLTAPALVFFGLAYMVPLGIFTTYGEVTVRSEGHLPVAYIITLAAMLFTALSYCQMTKKLPLSGSAYSYVQKTYGGNLGFLVGWAQLLDYLFLPMLNYLAIGIYMNAWFPDIPFGYFVLPTIIAVTTLNILGIKLINSMNMLIIILQFIFLAVFLFLCFNSIEFFDPETLLKPLLFEQNQLSGIFSGAAILCLAFLGFDAISTMAEETKDAKKALPRAIIMTVLIAGSMFIVISYFAHLVYPSWQDFIGNPDIASVDVVAKAGNMFFPSFFADSGKFFSSLFIAGYVTGVFASAMTSQASIVRILYAMGREGVLPKRVFARLHKRFHTPVISILFVGAFSLIALVISLDMIVSMISFGALIAFIFVNLSVIKLYIIDNKERSAKVLFTCLLLPAIGVCLTIWLWTSLDAKALKIGMTWLAIGLAYLIFMTRGFRRKPPTISDEEMDDIIN